MELCFIHVRSWDRALRSLFVALTLAVTPFFGASAGEGDRLESLGPQDVVEAHALIRLRRRSPRIELLKDPAFYAKAREAIQLVFQTYQNLYPQLMRGQPFPDFVVVSDADWFEAKALMFERVPGAKVYRGFLIIPSGLLANQLQPEIRLGILAHEFGHLYWQHRLARRPDVLEASRGSEALNREDVRALERFIYYADIVGAFDAEALSGFPTDPGILLDGLKMLTEELEVAPGSNCGEDAKASWERDIMAIFNHFDPLQWDLIFTEMSARQVRAGIQDFQRRLSACARAKNFQSEVLNRLEIPSGGIATFGFARLGEIFFRRPFPLGVRDAFTDLFEVSAKVHEDMRSLRRQHNLDRVRWKSAEDISDSLAVSVLKAMGLDARVYGAALLAALGRGHPELPQRCTAEIEAGRAVPFGYLASVHHSPCFRFQQILRWAYDPNFRVNL